jgi:hypothetical protein
MKHTLESLLELAKTDEGIREKAFIDARKGIHELHSTDGDVIAKFQWWEESGDADVGLQGWAGWVVIDEQPKPASPWPRRRMP